MILSVPPERSALSRLLSNSQRHKLACRSSPKFNFTEKNLHVFTSTHEIHLLLQLHWDEWMLWMVLFHLDNSTILYLTVISCWFYISFPMSYWLLIVCCYVFFIHRLPVTWSRASSSRLRLCIRKSSLVLMRESSALLTVRLQPESSHSGWHKITAAQT